MAVVVGATPQPAQRVEPIPRVPRWAGQPILKETKSLSDSITIRGETTGLYRDQFGWSTTIELDGVKHVVYVTLTSCGPTPITTTPAKDRWSR